MSMWKCVTPRDCCPKDNTCIVIANDGDIEDSSAEPENCPYECWSGIDGAPDWVKCELDFVVKG